MKGEVVPQLERQLPVGQEGQLVHVPAETDLAPQPVLYLPAPQVAHVWQIPSEPPLQLTRKAPAGQVGQLVQDPGLLKGATAPHCLL